MFQIIGIVLLFGMVFGGYTIAGGKMGVILHSLPYEMMMIGGAAVAALLMSNSVPTLKGVAAASARSSPAPNGRSRTTRTC